MYQGLLISACIPSGLVSIVSFFLYVHYRMRPRKEEGDGQEQEKKGTDRQNAWLDRQEGKYRQLHFVSLALFVLFGVLILVELSHRYNQPRISY
jgi:hypothetical protein